MFPGMPGVNPRQMKQMMKRMGVSQDEIEATQVIIKTTTSVLVFENPQVVKVNMMGQDSYQITGTPSEQALDTIPTINEEDISTVMEQTGVDKKTAEEAIEQAEGDLAQAILQLKSKE